MNVAINGFGRIGRHIMRRLINQSSVNVVAINDLTDTETLAHLFEFDTLYGRIVDTTIGSTADSLLIDDTKVKVYSESDPSNLPWKEHNVDVVIECTGKFTDEQGAAKHVEAGAKKVLISAPAKGDIKTIVLGVNDSVIDSNDTIISGASCTTNCLAPMVHVLHSNFKIDRGFVATTHAYTGDQRLIDAPHRDLRRSRSAALNIIPTSTGAAKAIGKVIPELAGKLDGNAIRVPVASGSLTELTIIVDQETSASEVNELLKQESESNLKGVLEYTEKPIVSSDILGNSHSCIFDSSLTKVNGNMIRVFGWYDNEVGYASRMTDLLKHLE